MSGLYELLSDELTREFTWRLREIHQLRSAIEDVAVRDKESVIRASFVLLYAHWEGFMKRSTQLFFDYLVKMNRPVRELHVGAKVVCIRRELLHSMSVGGRSNESVIRLLNLVASSDDKKLSRRNTRDMVDTSNMNFAEFADLCVLFGFDALEFEEHRDLIDKILVHRRHQIAHGAYLRVAYDDFVATSDRVIAVIRMFRNRMENSFLEISGKTGSGTAEIANNAPGPLLTA